MPRSHATLASASTSTDHDRQLYRLVLSIYLTVIPITALFFYTARQSDSVVMLAYLAKFLVSFIVQTFTLYAARQTLRNNPNAFPYGTGKLENFAAFMESLLILPAGLYLLFDASNRLAAPVVVSYGLTILPTLISGLRQTIFFFICRRMVRINPTPSPILVQNLMDFKIGLFSFLGVLAAFIVGGSLVHFGYPETGYLVDPGIGLLLALYMVYASSKLVWQNFRSLVDLPLSDREQLLVLGVLAAYYEQYDGVGAMYSRSSGNRKYVEVELAFPADKPLGEILSMSSRMEHDLETQMNGLTFRIIPIKPMLPADSS